MHVPAAQLWRLLDRAILGDVLQQLLSCILDAVMVRSPLLILAAKAEVSPLGLATLVGQMRGRDNGHEAEGLLSGLVRLWDGRGRSVDWAGGVELHAALDPSDRFMGVGGTPRAGQANDAWGVGHTAALGLVEGTGELHGGDAGWGRLEPLCAGFWNGQELRLAREAPVADADAVGEVEVVPEAPAGGAVGRGQRGVQPVQAERVGLGAEAGADDVRAILDDGRVRGERVDHVHGAAIDAAERGQGRDVQVLQDLGEDLGRHLLVKLADQVTRGIGRVDEPPVVKRQELGQLRTAQRDVTHTRLLPVRAGSDQGSDGGRVGGHVGGHCGGGWWGLGWVCFLEWVLWWVGFGVDGWIEL